MTSSAPRPDPERALSFGRHAAAYERARPAYPAAAARWLLPDDPEHVVELGAGTGKLTRALVAPGRRIVAVEPDARMRAVLAALDLPGVETRDGAAEAIPVQTGQVDAVVAGSAFHWFDVPVALGEIARVLRLGGTLAFAWNRRGEGPVWFDEVDRPIRGPGRWRGERDWAALVGASPFFAEVEQARFEHVLALPRDAIGDFLRSYSRVGTLPSDEQRELIAAAEAAVRANTPPDQTTLELPFVVEAYRTRRL